MKVNFKKDFIDCFGNPITETVKDPKLEGGTKEVPMTVWGYLAKKLFYLSTLSGQAADEKVKYQAYKLSLRIAKTPEDVEISTEEAVFIKQVAGENLSAGAYGIVSDLIEGK